MFCRNCGQPIITGAPSCTSCGLATGYGTNYCPNCGIQTPPGATICSNCGVTLAVAPPQGQSYGQPYGQQQGQPYGQPQGQYNPNLQKSKMAAGLLGIFLGSLGIHNFYLGFTGKAVAQLLITILSCGALSVVSGVWGLIEGIFYLVGKEGYTADSKGVPLKD